MAPVPGFSSASMGRGLPLPLPLVLILGALAIGTLVYILAPSLFKSAQPIDGTIILYTPEPWTTPSGEVFSGVVQYDVEAKDVSYLVTPGAPIVPLAVLGAVSPSGQRTLVAQTQESIELVSFSLTSKMVEGSVAIHSVGTVFTSVVWSPDEDRIAYRAVSSLPEGGHSEVRVGSTNANSPALTLAESIVAPLAFSPSGEELLVVKTAGISIVSLSGEQERIISFNASSDTTYFSASPDGRYLAVGSDGNSALYGIDWTAGSIAPVGTLSSPQVVFGSEDTLLGIDTTSSTVSEYRVIDGVLELVNLKSFKLPAFAQVLGWMP